MSDEFRAQLQALVRVRGVRAALIVDAEAGVPIEAELEDGMDGTAIAALATSLFRRSARATESAGTGTLRTLQLEADGGHLIAAGAADLGVVVLTEPDAQLGQVRVETEKLAEALR